MTPLTWVLVTYGGALAYVMVGALFFKFFSFVGSDRFTAKEVTGPDKIWASLWPLWIIFFLLYVGVYVPLAWVWRAIARPPGEAP